MIACASSHLSRFIAALLSAITQAISAARHRHGALPVGFLRRVGDVRRLS